MSMLDPCPNKPQCIHMAALHDIEEEGDPVPMCCAGGCSCGKLPEQMAARKAYFEDETNA